MKNGSSFLGGLLAGAAIGAVLALLYAPAKGEETRKNIRRKLDDLLAELEKLKQNSTSSFSNPTDWQQKIADLEKEIQDMKMQNSPNL